MPNNLSEQIRECDEQVVHCARQADAQIDPGVKRQFLELKRLWLLLAHYTSTERDRDIGAKLKLHIGQGIISDS
jgi:hypothetical protein